MQCKQSLPFVTFVTKIIMVVIGIRNVCCVTTTHDHLAGYLGCPLDRNIRGLNIKFQFSFDFVGVEPSSEAVDVANDDLIFERLWAVWGAGTAGSNSRAYL